MFRTKVGMGYVAQRIASDAVGLITRIFGGLLSAYTARSAVYQGEEGFTKFWLSDGYWAGIWFHQPEEVLVIYCRDSSSILSRRFASAYRSGDCSRRVMTAAK